MQSTDLYDVATQAISRHFKNTEESKVKSALLTLDPLDPKRAYLKLSRILEACNVSLRTAIFN